jgi:uncharacterized protein (TIGR02646 family)
MRRLTRPANPTFVPLAATEFAAARLYFEGTGRQNGFEFKAYRHGVVKTALSKMTGGNCAYCEADYDATAPVDVEHFRPKAEIETDAGLTKPGYWWLAASWDNLLPSCIRCNRKERVPLFDGSELVAGKGNRFPLDDEDSRAHEVGGEVDETPLLIDPCREDPADFIRFEDKEGKCIAVPVEQDPTANVLCPLLARSLAAACTSFSFQSASTTEAPASANAFAVASPNPEAAPVTRATLFSNDIFMLILLLQTVAFTWPLRHSVALSSAPR